MTQPTPPDGPPPDGPPQDGPLPPSDLDRTAALEKTADLLRQVREGQAGAVDRLVKRYLPLLRRWAHGRLPGHARDLSDTDDLVQITLIRALEHIEDFEPRREGAFLAYLRRILLNSLRDEIRRVNRRPVRKDVDDVVADPALVVNAVGVETLIAYERALARLPERQQEAVVLRIEFGFSFQEVADAVESPSANAARMMVTRALAQMAEVMDDRAEDEADGLERFAEAVADESPVDWEQALHETNDLGKSVRGLKALELIAAAHRESARSYDESASPPATGEAGDEPGPSAPVLFEWGPLRVLEKLGEGSYGEVYRAHDPRLSRDVALKLLTRDDGAFRAAERRNFLEEARRLARVSHPNVLTVHGADEHDDRIGLWAELLEGESLEERLRGNGPLGAHEAAVIGADLSRALAAIHAAGIVHGDVKASNVMRETGGAIVLLDFGSGRDLTLDDASGLREQSTGTPLSLAPEVLRGDPPSPASDLWALGVLLYRLVSARYPVPAKTFADLVGRHERGQRVPLRDVRPDLPASFVRLVERALGPDPARRFASAGEMERALGEFLAGDAATAPVDRPSPASLAGDPASVASRSAPGGEPRRFLRPALAVAAGLAVAFLGWRALAPDASALRIDTTLYAATASESARVLRSGDMVTVGDRLYLELETSEPVHVYVLDEDENGEMYVLFPVDGLETTNPLPRGRHRLPGNWVGVSQDWEVTSAGGRETILVVSSREPLPPIEQELAMLPRAEPGAMLAYAELDPTALEGLRGVAGLKPSRAEASAAGGRLARLAETFRQSASADDIWLRDIELVNR